MVHIEDGQGLGRVHTPTIEDEGDKSDHEVQIHKVPTGEDDPEEEGAVGVGAKHKTVPAQQNPDTIDENFALPPPVQLPPPRPPRTSPTKEPRTLPCRHSKQRTDGFPQVADQESGKNVDIKVVEQLTAALSQLTNKSQPNHNNTKGLHFSAPQFGGTENEFFSTWLRDYNDFAVCMGWPDDTKLRGLSMVLTGRAKQLFQDVDPSLKTTWVSAIRELEAKYNAASASSMTNFTLLERVQGRNESVSDYTVDMVHRLRVAGVNNESHKLSHYYKGLLPNIKRAVFILQPKTLDECERQAKLVEDNIKMNGEQSLTAVDDDVSTIGNTGNKPPEGQQKSITFQTGPNHHTEPRRNTYTRPSRYEQPRGRVINGAYTRAQRPQSGNTERRYRPRNDTPTPGPRNNKPYRPPHFYTQQQHNQAPPTHQPEGPYCNQCGTKHAWGQHVNPTCSKCGTPGHVRHECQHF